MTSRLHVSFPNPPPFLPSPTPKVEWVKMGHRLPAKAKLENHGKLLIVPGVEQEDGGHYMCRVKNALGEAVHYFTVTVEGSDCTHSGSLWGKTREVGSRFIFDLLRWKAHRWQKYS